MRSFEDVVSELTPVYKAKSHATWVEFEITTRCHLLPFYKTIPIERVGALWRHYCAGERTKNPDRKLWHDRKILRLILGYAFDCDYVGKIPRLQLDPYDKSHRVPVEVTLEMLLKVANKAPPLLKDMLIVLFYTGMRFGEVRCLKASQIDFTTGLVRLGAKATKTRKERVYHLTNEALVVLRLRALSSGGGYLFPMDQDPTRPVSKSYRNFERAKKRAGVEFNMHDLRHSFATRKIREGMPPVLLGQLIGASERVLNSVYAHADYTDWFRFGEKTVQ